MNTHTEGQTNGQTDGQIADALKIPRKHIRLKFMCHNLIFHTLQTQASII